MLRAIASTIHQSRGEGKLAFHLQLKGADWFPGGSLVAGGTGSQEVHRL
jgi:hypothetical protein